MTSIFQKYQSNPLFDKYKETARDLLRLSFPLLSNEEINAAMDWSISNRFQDSPANIDNNYKNENVNTTLAEVARYILDRRPILTSYGVMFQQHGKQPNPVYDLIDGFIRERKVLKKEMFKYPKGSENFEKYNLLQLLMASRLGRQLSRKIALQIAGNP